MTLSQPKITFKSALESKPEIEKKIMQLFAMSEQLASERKEINEKFTNLTEDFLAEDRPTTTIEFNSLLEKFSDVNIPVEPTNFESYLDYLANNVIAHSVHTGSPKFIGHMTSALPYFVQPLAKLMMAMNQNVVKIETSKALSPYERQALAMIHRLIYNFSDRFYAQHIQNSQSTLGILVSGGTAANITALWCARNTSLGPKDDFPGIESEGLVAALNYYGYKEAVVIGSDLMHYSFDKAADLLGIGARGLIKVKSNSNNRIDIPALQQTVADCQAQNKHIIAIVGVAGTTDSGGVDSLTEIAAIAREANVHFHVDAAWGGALIFSQQYQHKLAGIEQADSVTIDGHKQLYLPMNLGMLFLRNPHIAKVIEKNATYTIRKGSFDLGKRALEGSRSGMALFLHAGLNLIGIKGYEFLIDEGIHKTQYLANRIRELPEFELLAEPEINLLIYRYIPENLRARAAQKQLTEIDNQRINQFNEILQKKQRQAGRTFISRTTKTNLERTIPIVALRAVIANPLTTEKDIDEVLNDQIQIALEIANSTSLESADHVA
ncbi:pyridoxal-dependent aspartate 1-decarboxylase PanP [Oscillatoria salina]|uniref:pyridoxal-dependent aspartate 1-decarboxylase PanP n=1 Tax=Oscillatoria salina TaxID=331517 RepID=UPI0013BC134B|nr:putative pyridoxal-dependent aspartate 1-decarboxylase [Oscillatoria salina]MBZ8179846.1 putative pyridoxal-dependent aspartate 1-decarboxylase [Oscillatoria salina IIICB1]NET88082.1 putative pyridoxal-dependent aspartate 1-decarboxylase [Kamptonema sp. SIO1D9]